MARDSRSDTTGGRSDRRRDRVASGEDLGWLDDLRQARAERTAIGPQVDSRLPRRVAGASGITGETPVVPRGHVRGRPATTGEHPPVRRPTGEQAVWRPTGEQRTQTGGQPAVQPVTGEQAPAPRPTARRALSRFVALGTGVRVFRRRSKDAADDAPATAPDGTVRAPTVPVDDETPWSRPVRRPDPRAAADAVPEPRPQPAPRRVPGPTPAPGPPPTPRPTPAPGPGPRPAPRPGPAPLPVPEPRPGPAPRPGPEPRPRPEPPTAARALLVRQQRHARRVRRLTLIAVVGVLLGALPGYLLIREGVKDPVFDALDALAVPAWAAHHPVSAASGSRWCVKTCRYRERITDSERPTAETDAAYQRALRLAGWRTASGAGCPRPADGIYSCWRRDEFVLDLWTRDAICDLDAPGGKPSGAAARPGATAAPGATTWPGGGAAPGTGGRTAAPGTTAGQPGSGPQPADGLTGCPGSKVTMKVTNGIDPRWHR